MRRFMIVAATSGIIILLFWGIWVVTYPSPADPKNIRYVLWKAGLYKMDLDQVTEAMVGDPRKYKLVAGKSESELQKEFGYLMEPSQASPYLSGCYQNSSWKGQRVLFIRKSPWMVVFTDGKATDLVLIKGC